MAIRFFFREQAWFTRHCERFKFGSKSRRRRVKRNSQNPHSNAELVRACAVWQLIKRHELKTCWRASLIQSRTRARSRGRSIFIIEEDVGDPHLAGGYATGWTRARKQQNPGRVAGECAFHAMRSSTLNMYGLRVFADRDMNALRFLSLGIMIRVCNLISGAIEIPASPLCLENSIMLWIENCECAHTYTLTLARSVSPKSRFCFVWYLRQQRNKAVLHCPIKGSNRVAVFGWKWFCDGIKIWWRVLMDFRMLKVENELFEKKLFVVVNI